LDALTKIGHAVANLGVDEILDLIYEQAAQIMDLTDAQVQIAFYDNIKDQVTFPLAVEQDKESGGIIDRVRWGKREKQFRRPDERGRVKQFMPRTRRDPPGLTEYVIRKKESVLIIEDFEERARKLGVQVWPEFGRFNRPTHSWLGVPMIVQGQVIGIISIQSLEQEMAFDRGHVKLLETVANQAAVAIENARLLEKERERARQLEGLQQISLKITASLDLQEVLYSIAENTNYILKSDFTTIFPYSEERGFGKGARAGKFADQPSTPSEDGICAKVVESVQPVQVEDAASYPGTDPDLLNVKNVKSFIGVPVKFGDRAIGVILANYVQRHIFTPPERNLAQQIAALAAVAIENATRAELIADRERYMTMVGLAADLVHRINNKAGTIPIRVQQLQAQLDLDNPRDSALQHIAQGIAQDARDLLTESAELEHLGETGAPPNPSVVSIYERLETIASKIQVECPDSIEVITDIATDLPPVRAVTEELDHVLWSVANNGVEAMLLEGKQEGGMLIIRARPVEKDHQTWIEIRISDQGPGIPVQMRDRLFEPFYSTRPGRFRGFGLWRARQVLRKLGGSIQLAESKRPGTTFVIELPALEDNQEV
jgi:GAF domain-containing protein